MAANETMLNGKREQQIQSTGSATCLPSSPRILRVDLSCHVRDCSTIAGSMFAIVNGPLSCGAPNGENNRPHLGSVYFWLRLRVRVGALRLRHLRISLGTLWN
jgi:hypothetical protein